VVEARPPSTGYRLRKFVRRHRGQMVAASLVFLALVGGIIGTSWGLARARWERDKAIQAESAERAARQHEEEQRKYAEAIASFVRDDFLALTSVEGQYRFGREPEDSRLNKDTTLQQLLDRAAAKLSQRRDLDPRTEAELNFIVGVNYRALGEAKRAVPYLERCVDLCRRVLGRDHELTPTALNSLAVARDDAGQLDAALPLFEEALRLSKDKWGPDHPGTLHIMNNLATGYREARKPASAIPLLEEALRLSKAKLGPDHLETSYTILSLAMYYEDTGQLDAALPLLEEALRIDRATRGPDHPKTIMTMANLATSYWRAKRLDRSVPLFEEVFKLYQKKLGRNHPETLMAMANLGVNYKDAGRLSEALPQLEEGYRAGRTKPALYWVGGRLLDGYAKAKRSADAAALSKELLSDARKSFPGDDPRLANVLGRTGSALLQLGTFAEAEPLLRECLTVREKVEPDLWSTFDTQSLLGAALLGQKKYVEAEPLLRRGYEGTKARERVIWPIKATCLPEAVDRLIELYAATNRPDEVKKWQAERARYDNGDASKPGAKK
jgi:tetratricopeptide (TPR) repeat protein